ncbi:uncharacterized protein LOC119724029 [Patiria miniata]|uniref:Uncharacterized protein n=1 Tax=Patiria miniata TaxID=46514 RepID=A0A913ZIL0_PATMI|nr:uncharacterized protein LOC119724029 [Patiria miniata]XP_038050885.1 uncharacterized protein LOC119724029 [Patiria miniata]
METPANDFYLFFRSGNHHEMHTNLVKLSRHSGLDKQDLALLVLLLTQYMVDTQTRRQVLGDTECRGALQTILDTVQQNETARNSRPTQSDVDEIMNLLTASPAICDVYNR